MTPEERFTKIENAIYALTEVQARHESGIRDLITVSRIFLDSQKEISSQIQGITTQIQELRDAQQHTDEKLNALIDTVDRIIRSRNGRGDKE